MARSTRFALLCALLAAVWAPSAQAARPVLPETLQSTHFQVHYEANPTLAWRINVIQANQIAAIAERAYAAYVSWGYATPLDDGDGYLDLYVLDEPDGVWGAASADNAFALTSSASAQLDATQGIDDHKVAHLVFHLFQAASWQPMSTWLREGAAEWAAFRLLGFPKHVYSDDLDEDQPLTEFATRPDIPLDCGGAQCGDTVYEQGSYQAWPFLTYLGERYGTGLVKELHDRGAAGGDPAAPALDFLTQVLATKGANLTDVFTDWSVAALSGAYQADGLKASAPEPYTTVATGETAGALPTVKVPVNHLAARFLGFQRGTRGSSGPCYAATLSLTVAIPAGTTSRPHFLWPGVGSAPVPLAISGSTAALSIPWDTCSWTKVGLLSLPNASPTLDGTEFTVASTLAVDRKTPINSTPPPPASYTGPTIAAPVVDDAPSIALYGPELLRVSKKKRLVRLIVFSSGTGSLEAQLGTLRLGTRVLRTGNNELRFTLPVAAVRRRLTAVSNLLTLTSLSDTGARGATVTRRVLITK